MSNHIKFPNSFCVLVDKDGDVQDVVPIHDDIIWSVIRKLDKENAEYAPHIPLYWNGTTWIKW